MAAMPELVAWLTAMPKAELHLHLDGSLRPQTALELARTSGAIDEDGRPMAVPADLAAVRAQIVAPPRCRDQAELLRAFELPVALLQDVASLERCAAELAEDVAGDGTRYAEVRWAPSLHTRRGLTLTEVIDAVARGSRRGSEGSRIAVRLIVVALRSHPQGTAVAVARAAAGFASDGVVGFDLAGVEREAPDPGHFAAAFDIARSAGLGITCHAGEWGGAPQVRAALSIEPLRIAHGAPAIDDPDLVGELRRRDITLDLCPTSNVQAGIFAEGADAPLPRLIRAGVPVTISTDDRTVSDLTLPIELERAVTRYGITTGELLTAMRQAYRAAFLHHDEALRTQLLADFEAWLALDPPPETATAQTAQTSPDGHEGPA